MEKRKQKQQRKRQKRLAALNWLITLAVFAWTVWQAVTTFQTSYLRMGEAFRDFGLSIKFFFCLLLGHPNYTMPTVNNFSDMMPWRLIPEEWAVFWASVVDYFGLLFRGSNLKAYGAAIMGVTETVAKAGLVLLPCVLILAVAVKQLYKSLLYLRHAIQPDHLQLLHSYRQPLSGCRQFSNVELRLLPLRLRQKQPLCPYP